jgi:hypothetical protein
VVLLDPFKIDFALNCRSHGYKAMEAARIECSILVLSAAVLISSDGSKDFSIVLAIFTSERDSYHEGG